MDFTCKVCGSILTNKRSKTCGNSKCKSKWKMERNKVLKEVNKTCKNCHDLFQTVDRRNNYCSYKCKSESSNKTKLEKYGSLSLESKESIQSRSEKLIKPKVLCRIDGCLENSRSNGYCSNHYIKFDYLKTEHGKEVYRLGTLRRRDLESSRVITKSELEFIRSNQVSCAKCGTTNNLSLDHHIPLTKGGSLELMNVIVLCTTCNSSKSNKNPEEFYTKEELLKIQSYFDFVKKSKNNLKKIYFLFGCFGAGKSWVSNQLTDKFTVIDYDQYKRKSIDAINSASIDKPILYVSSIMITPFLNKYSTTYNIVSIALVENLETIKERIKSRGGVVTENVIKRQKRIEVIAKKYSDFSGNSLEVLEYLQKEKA